MNPYVIIPVRRSDAWVSIGLKEHCDSLASTPATLRVYKPSCCKPIRECIGVNECGDRQYRVTYPTVPSVTLTSTELDCNGRIAFVLTPGFTALGKGRLDAVLTVCGITTQIKLQVFGEPVMASYDTGSYVDTVDYSPGETVVGKLAVFGTTCLVPEGWVAVTECLSGALIGYARTTKSFGFCVPYTITCGGVSQVWLRPA